MMTRRIGISVIALPLLLAAAAAARAAEAPPEPAQKATDGKANDKKGGEERADAQAREIAIRLARPLQEVNFEGVAFAEVVDFLRDVTGVNVWVDWAALDAAGVDRAAPVTLTAKQVSTANVLVRMLGDVGGEKAKLGYKVTGPVVVVSTADGLKAAAEAGRALAAKAADPGARAAVELVALPELNFDGVALTDVIDFVRDISGATVVVDWDKLKAAGVERTAPVNVRLRDVPLGQALWLILREASGPKGKLAFSITDKTITISTAEAIKAAKKAVGENPGKL